MRTLTAEEKKMIEKINGTMNSRTEYFEAVAEIMNGQTKSSNRACTAKNKIMFEDGTAINMVVRKNVIKQIEFSKWTDEEKGFEVVKF